MSSNKVRLVALLLCSSCLGAGQATASTVISSVLGGAPSGSGISYVNFDNMALGGGGGSAAAADNTGAAQAGVTVSFVTDAQVVSGASGGVYAPPFLSGSNGNNFGPSLGNSNQALGADATRYLTSGAAMGSNPNARVEVTLPNPAQYVGLLWGSIDSYNTLKLLDAGNNLVATITGSDVTATPGGDQGTNGTRYVNINSDVAFTKLVFSSSNYAFEFDNVAFSASNQNVDTVPLPAAAWLFGSVLGAGGLLARRRRKTAQTKAA